MNTSLFFFFYNFTHKSPWFDSMVTFIAGTFDKVVLVLAVAYLLIYFLLHKDWKHRKCIVWVRECFIIGMSIFSAWIVAFCIKAIAHVARPFVVYPQVIPLIQNEPPYQSFPSAHSTIFFALATAIYLYDKRVGILFFMFAVMIALSRVIVGVHYPIDIIIGAVLGIGIARIVHHWLSRVVFLKIS